MDVKFEVCLKFHACKSLNYFSRLLKVFMYSRKCPPKKEHTKISEKSSRFVSSNKVHQICMISMKKRNSKSKKHWYYKFGKPEKLISASETKPFDVMFYTQK